MEAPRSAYLALDELSRRWRAVGVKRAGTRGSRHFTGICRDSAGRAVASFEYSGSRSL